MNQNTDVGRIAAGRRFKTTEDLLANSHIRLFHEIQDFNNKPASSWPGGTDAEDEDGVTVLGHTISVAADTEDSLRGRVAMFTLLLTDSEVRITAEIAPGEGMLFGSLGTSALHDPMEPGTATQIFRHYMEFYEANPITLHSGT